MKTLYFAFAFFLILFSSCKKEDNQVNHPTTKYNISLTDDYHITSIRYYINDYHAGDYSFSYTNEIITVKKTDHNNILLSKSIYYLHNQLADSSVDSIYLNSELDKIKRTTYEYDEDNYLIFKTIRSNKYIPKKSLTKILYTYNYEYTNGNHEKVITGQYGVDIYVFNSLENKLNLDNFIGEHCGKLNRNLIERFNDGDGGQMIPEKDTYSYDLYDNGLVKKIKKSNTGRYHYSMEPEITVEYFEYEYFFE